MDDEAPEQVERDPDPGAHLMWCPRCKEPGPEPTCPTCNEARVPLPTGLEPPPELLLRTIFDQRYRVEEVIGEGGCGHVFRVRDLRLGCDRAMKVLKPKLTLDPSAFRRFYQEARLTSNLKSHHTVHVTDFGIDRGHCFLVMELLQGASLKAVLRREGALDPYRAARIAAQICLSLDEAHAGGAIHRDLKPANIYLCQERHTEDVVKVIDFGIAKIVEQDPTSEKITAIAQRTESGAVIGTPAYFSPEQAQGRPLDLRSDLFSLGTVLYELLTGQLPFISLTSWGLLTQISCQPAPPPPERVHDRVIPAALRQLVTKLHARDPADRPGSALAVYQELSRITGDERSPPRIADHPLPPDSQAQVAQAISCKAPDVPPPPPPVETLLRVSSSPPNGQPAATQAPPTAQPCPPEGGSEDAPSAPVVVPPVPAAGRGAAKPQWGGRPLWVGVLLVAVLGAILSAVLLWPDGPPVLSPVREPQPASAAPLAPTPLTAPPVPGKPADGGSTRAPGLDGPAVQAAGDVQEGGSVKEPDPPREPKNQGQPKPPTKSTSPRSGQSTGKPGNPFGGPPDVGNLEFHTSAPDGHTKPDGGQSDPKERRGGTGTGRSGGTQRIE